MKVRLVAKRLYLKYFFFMFIRFFIIDKFYKKIIIYTVSNFYYSVSFPYIMNDMHEFVSDAFVLGRRPRGELDLTVDLYTEQMGRIEGRVISGQKISSKFSQHLNVPNLVRMRIVVKNAFTVTDALTLSTFSGLKEDGEALQRVFRVFFLLRVATPQHAQDERLWKYLSAIMPKNTISMKEIMDILGYDVSSALCASCKSPLTSYFEYGEGSFLCDPCGVKQYRDKVILIT